MRACVRSQSCLTLCDSMDCSPPGSSWNSLGEDTGVGCRFRLKERFPTQRWNPRLTCLLHWQVGSSPLAQLGSPKWKWPRGLTVRGILQARIVEWVAFAFSRGSSQPRAPALQADSFPAEPSRLPWWRREWGCGERKSAKPALPGSPAPLLVHNGYAAAEIAYSPARHTQRERHRGGPAAAASGRAGAMHEGMLWLHCGSVTAAAAAARQPGGSKLSVAPTAPCVFPQPLSSSLAYPGVSEQSQQHKGLPRWLSGKNQPVQEARTQSLILDDPVSHRALSPYPTTVEPVLESLGAANTGPICRKDLDSQQGKPLQWESHALQLESSPGLPQLEKSPCRKAA